MPDDAGNERAIRVSLGPLTPFLRSMLVELLANVPDVQLVENAPRDVLLLEADAEPSRSRRCADLGGEAQLLARAAGLSGILLMEPSGRQATVVHIRREQLDLGVEGRTALLAAIRRAAHRAEPGRASG